MDKFTKDMLKSGMWVQYYNGSMRMVIKQFLLVDGVEDILVNENGEFITTLTVFNENLTSMLTWQQDIVRVYPPNDDYSLKFKLNYPLWQRYKPKRMTKVEIESALGFPIELVEE